MSTDQVKNGLVVSLRGFPIYDLDVSLFDCVGQLDILLLQSSLLTNSTQEGAYELRH